MHAVYITTSSYEFLCFVNTGATVLSLEILVASDFDKVAGTAFYHLQFCYI